MNIEYIKIEKLIQAEYNPRKLSTAQYEHIKSSLLRFGMVDPIIVNSNPERMNIIIGGHQRTKVWKDLGNKEIPVYYINLPIEKEKELNVRLNKNTGEFDFDLLNEFFEKDDLLDWGFEEIDFPELEEIEPEKTNGDDEVKTKVEARTVKGDIYVLGGKHRVLCGDSTMIDDVEKLMDGKKADMVFTDPPYGVSYVGKTKEALTIKSDDLPPEKLKEKTIEWFNGVDFAIRDGAYALATVPARPLHLIFAQDWLDRGWLRQIMVWNKDSMVLGHSEYHYKHEPILFGWKPGERLKNYNRTKTTVWDFDRPKRSEDHPTMKPVEMWEFGINQHTKANNLLYEPFLGSGTTLIASEKTNRICYGMELDEHYCDVIVNRYVSWCKENKRDWSVELNGVDITNKYG